MPRPDSNKESYTVTDLDNLKFEKLQPDEFPYNQEKAEQRFQELKKEIGEFNKILHSLRRVAKSQDKEIYNKSLKTLYDNKWKIYKNAVKKQSKELVFKNHNQFVDAVNNYINYIKQAVTSELGIIKEIVTDSDTADNNNNNNVNFSATPIPVTIVTNNFFHFNMPIQIFYPEIPAPSVTLDPINASVDKKRKQSMQQEMLSLMHQKLFDENHVNMKCTDIIVSALKISLAQKKSAHVEKSMFSDPDSKKIANIIDLLQQEQNKDMSPEELKSIFSTFSNTKKFDSFFKSQMDLIVQFIDKIIMNSKTPNEEIGIESLGRLSKQQRTS